MSSASQEIYESDAILFKQVRKPAVDCLPNTSWLAVELLRETDTRLEQLLLTTRFMFGRKGLQHGERDSTIIMGRTEEDLCGLAAVLGEAGPKDKEDAPAMPSLDAHRQSWINCLKLSKLYLEPVSLQKLTSHIHT